MRIYEWDFDRSMVTLYERQGECNGCGDCCKRLIFYGEYGYARTKNHADDVAQHCREHGIEPVKFENIFCEPLDDNPERKAWQYQVTDVEDICPALLIESLQCEVHNTAEKPEFCNVFPVRPKDIESFPDCSYRFEKIEEWSIEDD